MDMAYIYIYAVGLESMMHFKCLYSARKSIQIKFKKIYLYSYARIMCMYIFITL